MLDSAGRPQDIVFCTKWDGCYHIHVSKDLFMREDYVDTLWHTILTSPLENKGRYVYSDLDYYFLAAVIEKVTGLPLNRYVSEQFYGPMGLRMTGYLPLQFIRPTLIAPTENDQAFRHETLQGYV